MLLGQRNSGQRTERPKERERREAESENSGGCGADRERERECEQANLAQEVDKSPILMVSLRKT